MPNANSFEDRRPANVIVGFRAELGGFDRQLVADSRDLSQIYQRDAGSPDPLASCLLFSAFGA